VKDVLEAKEGYKLKMARVAQPPPLIRTGSAPSGYGKALPNKASKHKVVLESVTQEKKKLRSVVCYSDSFNFGM
jgi:hypothetical protein